MMAKVNVTLEKIAEVEGITVTDEDVEAEYAALAAQYDMDVEKYVLSPERHTRAGELKLPMFAGCDFAAVYYGRAMGSEVPAGSIVVMRKVDDWQTLVPGSDCIVVCDKMVLFRRLRRSDNPEVMLLSSPAAEQFDSVEVAKTDIRAIYRLEGVIQAKRY